MAKESLPKAKKSLGQNFLQDANIARKIVDALEITREDRIIEIGPGPGALTKLIAAKEYKHLVIIDKDDDFAKEHAQNFMGQDPRNSLPGAIQYAKEHTIGVAAADALAAPWEELQEEEWKFISNLPYNIASPLMWDIVSTCNVKQAVFMIQKEVAERIVAKPGTSAYGALSVWIQSFVVPKLLFIVPPQVFYPRPKVHSAVVVFRPIEKMCCSFDKIALSKALKYIFSYRRKQLGTILKHVPKIDVILNSYGITRDQRPETLTPHQFHQLSKEINIQN